MESNEKKVSLWNPSAVGNWSIVFTPMLGAWLLSKNWKELNEPDKAKKALLWTYVGIALVIISMFLDIVMDMDSSLSLAIPFLIIWYFVECRKQVKHIKESLKNEYDKKPWGGVMLKGLGIIILSIVLAFVVEAFEDNSNSAMEEAALPLVNKILANYSYHSNQSTSKCLGVELGEEFAKNHYKANAILENGKKIGVIITLKGNYIEVAIPE